METLNKIKVWWLVATMAITLSISCRVFNIDTKARKNYEHDRDSLSQRIARIECVKDSLSVIYNSVMGERDALSRQLDRKASQQIIIDKRTTNITRQYIMKKEDTSNK